MKIVEVGTGHGQVPADALLVHDAHHPDPSTAFAISRLTDSGYLNQSPIGIFRQVERPTYDDQARAQVTTARGGDQETADARAQRLAALIGAGDTPEERAVLAAVDGARTVREVVAHARMGTFEVSKILFQLLTSRLLRR